MTDTALTLLALAAHFLGQPIPEERPDIRYVPQQILQNKICPGKRCRIEALHDKGVILLSETMLEKDEIIQNGILLHELVHFVQYKSGKILTTCEGQREMEDEAYALQEFYLNDNGVYLGGPIRFGAMELTCKKNN